MNKATAVSRMVSAPRPTTAIRNPTSDNTAHSPFKIRREQNVSQSPMDAEGDAVMTEFIYVGQPTISQAAVQICIFVPTPARPHQMEYTMPASTTPLRTIVTMPAVSRMESCQSASDQMPCRYRWRLPSESIDLDHGSSARAGLPLTVRPPRTYHDLCSNRSELAWRGCTWGRSINSGIRECRAVRSSPARAGGGRQGPRA